MRVKIKDCTCNWWWYNNYINKDIDVYDTNNKIYFNGNVVPSSTLLVKDTLHNRNIIKNVDFYYIIIDGFILREDVVDYREEKLKRILYEI